MIERNGEKWLEKEDSRVYWDFSIAEVERSDTMLELREKREKKSKKKWKEMT